MFPTFLLRGLIFAVGRLVPCYAALHCVVLHEQRGVRKLLLYLALHTVLMTFVLPLLEPLLLGVSQVLFLNLYYELKLAALTFCLMPRFGLIDLLDSEIEKRRGKAEKLLADTKDRARGCYGMAVQRFSCDALLGMKKHN